MNFLKSLLLFFILLFCSSKIHAESIQDSDTCFYGNRISGCNCFVHCKCFNSYLETSYLPDGFPKEWNKYHPKFPADQTWHTFMVGILSALTKGPQGRTIDEMDLAILLGFRTESYDNTLCLLIEYLDSIENVREEIQSAKDYNLKFIEKWFPDPAVKAKKIRTIEQQAITANAILAELPIQFLNLTKSF